jgi:hydrogenase nickel incorporation protein HypA/HybF
MNISEECDVCHKDKNKRTGTLNFNSLIMHELSIINSIIEVAESEMRGRREKYRVDAITLHIGALAGVEVDSLEFLWPAAVENTVLENAACRIVRIAGQAACQDCGDNFIIEQYYDPCPVCGSHLLRIVAGEELKIKSIELCALPADAAVKAPN